MARITKAEKERRVTQIVELLLNGVSRAQILQFAAKSGWKVADRSVDDYIAAATEQIKTSAAYDRDYEIAKAKERLEYLYQTNMIKQDHREARMVIKAQAELMGLDAPSKTALTDLDGNSLTIHITGNVNPDKI